MGSLLTSFLFLAPLSSRCLCSAATTITTFGNTTVGTHNVAIDIVIDTENDTVDIMMSGPSDRWFAIGFGSTVMANTYTISASGTDTINERLLGDQSTGNILD